MTSSTSTERTVPPAPQSPAERASALEALLFFIGEPTQCDMLARALNISVEDVEKGLEDVARLLGERGSGLTLLRASDGVQLVTAPAHAERLEAFLVSGMREQLTPSAAETLAIVAYRGPIHRAGIEAIRGVNSSFTLRVLTIRGLVDRIPSPTDSRVYLYRVNATFLRHLGLTDAQGLPDYEHLHTHAGMAALEKTVEGNTGRPESVPSVPAPEPSEPTPPGEAT